MSTHSAPHVCVAADENEKEHTAILMPRPAQLTLPTASDIAFLAQFVHRAFDYSYHSVDPVAHTRSSWRSLERRTHTPLGDDELMRHLRQTRGLAAHCAVENSHEGETRCVTSWIVIDLDHHGDDDDLRARMRGVIAALGQPSFVHGSPSGGAHVYYCLDEWTHIYELHVVDSPWGLVTRLLESHGVRVARGNAEVYPQPRSASRKGNVIRLPFGIGSWLLDPFDLTLRAEYLQGVDALRWVRDGLAHGKVSVTSVAEWRAKAKLCAAPQPRTYREPGHSAIAEAERHFAPFVDGLTQPGTRETAVAAHAFLCRARGCTLEEAVQRTCDWLAEHHNGKSLTVARRGLAHCLKEAEATVKRVYNWKGGSGAATRVALPALTLAEVKPIIQFAMNAGKCVDAAGKPLDPFFLAQHAFWLTRYAVQEALTNVRDKETLRREDGRTRLTGRAWPDCTKELFVVPISWALRRKKIVDPRTGQEAFTAPAAKESAIFEALIAGPTPLLRKVHGHCRETGMCAHFEVRIDLAGDRYIHDIGTAFLLAGGGARLGRSRLRPCHWKLVAPAFAQPDAPLIATEPSKEVLKARAIQTEALARAAVASPAYAATAAVGTGIGSLTGSTSRSTSWVSSELACADGKRVAVGEGVAAAGGAACVDAGATDAPLDLGLVTGGAPGPHGDTVPIDCSSGAPLTVHVHRLAA